MDDDRSAMTVSSPFAAAPVDQTNRRPDTHPELRSGLWQVAFNNFEGQGFSVVEAPVVQPDAPVADTTHLLTYNPEALNAVAAVSPGSVVIEAAGSPRYIGNTDQNANESIQTETQTERTIDADINRGATKTETEIKRTESEIKTETKSSTDVEIK
jgi:hypothetical protein